MIIAIKSQDEIAQALEIDGKMIKSIKINTSAGFKVVDTRGWKPGTYSIVLSDNGKLLGTSKIIKVK